jgi:hypothetical protein
MNNTKYITLQSDTWFNIAHKAYGDASKYGEIISANFGAPAIPTLRAGMQLLIPIIADQNETNKDLLPPWKRGTTESEALAAAAVKQFDNIITEPAGSFDGSFD